MFYDKSSCVMQIPNDCLENKMKKHIYHTSNIWVLKLIAYKWLIQKYLKFDRILNGIEENSSIKH